MSEAERWSFACSLQQAQESETLEARLMQQPALKDAAQEAVVGLVLEAQGLAAVEVLLQLYGQPVVKVSQLLPDRHASEAAEPVPGQAAMQQVKHHDADSFHIIAAALFQAKLCVCTCKPSCATEGPL
eukprot:CAMPEP_0197624570 /NCGR_PEP_ID=MMETSP1338-20131121/4155_1 /TAXON_ID=43686 ORGANISM="Pelagodinium beii, Strain RCC1491" /NCGR_SAMPLE_ID=MMETSP1338 /ASSEMBLY_ACC=CAM_ASM_000754 /LENGTH=127 /DNA_ID=CAMNT_0043194725 /DNA_START=85 /DNA_END=468 /DNA_ORIENTATION=-